MTNKKKNRGGRCPICRQNRPWINQEDIMPIWARETILGIPPTFPGEHAPPRIQMPICEPCNSKMGALYEAPAAPLIRPLIRGEVPGILTSEQQGIVGRWVVKTGLLFFLEKMLSRGPLAGPPSALVHGMNQNNGAPPPGCSVRIGRSNMGEVPLGFLFASEESLLPGGPPPWRLTAGVMRWGFLVFEYIVGRPDGVTDFIARSPNSTRLFRVWPTTTETLVFNPTQPISEAEFQRLHTGLLRGSGGFRFQNNGAMS